MQVATRESTTGLGAEQLREIYYYLQLTRQVENVLTNLYRQNKIIGGLYRSLGQEGTAVASAYALQRRTDGTGDALAPAIRNLGSLFVMGARPADVMCQYMAKLGSPTRGREQNVHFTDYERGFIGLISHLGVMIEVMAGVALSFKLRGEPRVALAYSGEGATSTGGFHEGFNLAAVQRAPLVVIVENNCYAYSTPTHRQTACGAFVDKAPGYGVHGDACDGNDVFAVYEMTRRAVDRARRGEGASLLEVTTYRRLGHAEHDAQGYVPKAELEEWAGRDPIDRFERRVLDEALLEEEELAAIRERVGGEVDAAREEAESSPLPPIEEALEPVWSVGPPHVPWTRREAADPREA